MSELDEIQQQIENDLIAAEKIVKRSMHRGGVIGDDCVGPSVENLAVRDVFEKIVGARLQSRPVHVTGDVNASHRAASEGA